MTDAQQPSSTYEYFLETFFGDPYIAWHDGLNISVIHRLKGEDLIRAERKLIEALCTHDWRPPVGLGEMQSEAAVPHLCRMLNCTRGRVLVNVAVALWKITGDTGLACHVIKVLQNSPHWADRIDAAIALREFPLEKVVDALLTTIHDDEDPLPRAHAAESLLMLCGQPTDLIGAGTIPLRAMVMSQDPAELAAAACKLEAIARNC